MVQIYKCPSCGANMTFDAQSQQLSCPYCGRKMPISEYKEPKQKEPEQKEPEQKEPEQPAHEEQAASGTFKMFHCPSCGAELLTDEYTTATFCNYCGSSALIESRLEGEDAPELVIPFQITKEKAREAYLSWAKRGLLTPPGFVSRATVEKISGLYVPFWLYDYNVQAFIEADCTRTRVQRTKNEEIIYTDHFDVQREVHATYEKVPADASEKMNDALMDKLEPFSYDKLTPFKMEYLSGFFAEKYNYTSGQLRERADARVKEYGARLAMDSIRGYEMITPVREDVNLQLTRTRYAMLPVWMLNYRYMGKDYMFTMNGQTGKIIGEIPVSKGKVAAYFVLITALIFGLAMAFFYFFL